MDLYLYLRWASILVTGLVLFLTLKQSKQSVILIQEQSNKLEQENSNILFHLQLHEDSHHLSKLSILCDQDKQRVDSLMRLDPENMSLDDFDAYIMDPLVTTCNELKKIGGRMLADCKVFDGHKFVCMDDMLKPIGKCLIYSFGVGKDITFERQINKLGCTVHMFDPTVGKPLNLTKTMTFTPIGVAAINGINKKRQKFMPLLDILKLRDHVNTTIDYLKMDVEGDEIDGLLVWIQSGALDHVQQIGLEIHETMDINNARQLTGSFQALYQMGFRLISYDPNLCMTKRLATETKHIGFSEVVFARPTAKMCSV